MGRRRWTALDMPSGWIQVLRGPRPPSSRPAVQIAQPPRQTRSGKGVPQVPRAPPVRVSPDESREAARIKVAKLEKALGVMGDAGGQAVECLKAELAKAKAASTRRPIAVEVEECRKFISRSDRRISELDAERASEATNLQEAKERLQRLEAEQAAPPAPVPCLTDIDLDAEVVSLRAKLLRTEEERDAALAGAPVKRQAVCRGQVRGGQHMPPMPGLVPGELTRWMEDRHSDLPLSCDDHQAILELTSKLAEGASRLHEMSGGISR